MSNSTIGWTTVSVGYRLPSSWLLAGQRGVTSRTEPEKFFGARGTGRTVTYQKENVFVAVAKTGLPTGTLVPKSFKFVQRLMKQSESVLLVGFLRVEH